MMMLTNLLFTLLLLVAPSLSLSLSKVAGPAPLETVATANVVGPYEGVVCFAILEDGDPVVMPWCEEDQPLQLAEGEKGAVHVELTGKVVGEYEVVAFLPDVDPHVYSDKVKVVVEPSKVKAE
jgi:hypothetical protein